MTESDANPCLGINNISIEVYHNLFVQQKLRAVQTRQLFKIIMILQRTLTRRVSNFLP